MPKQVIRYEDDRGGIHLTEQRARKADADYAIKKVKDEFFQRIEEYYTIDVGKDIYHNNDYHPLARLTPVSHQILETLLRDGWITIDAQGTPGNPI